MLVHKVRLRLGLWLGVRNRVGFKYRVRVIALELVYNIVLADLRKSLAK